MKIIWTALAIIIFLAVLTYFMPYREYQDINIKTGQARFTSKVWFITLSERIEETPLSVALDGETVDINDMKDWHRANSFTLGSHVSPHYRFHSALYQAHQFRMTDHLVSPANKKKLARSVLEAWQTSGSDHGASDIIYRILEEEISNKPVDPSG